MSHRGLWEERISAGSPCSADSEVIDEHFLKPAQDEGSVGGIPLLLGSPALVRDRNGVGARTLPTWVWWAGVICRPIGRTWRPSKQCLLQVVRGPSLRTFFNIPRILLVVGTRAVMVVSRGRAIKVSEVIKGVCKLMSWVILAGRYLLEQCDEFLGG